MLSDDFPERLFIQTIGDILEARHRNAALPADVHDADDGNAAYGTGY